MDFIDLAIGILLGNAIAHFMLGITKTKFLRMFGYSFKGNIVYGILQLIICLLLFHFHHNLFSVLQHGIFLGVFIVLIFFIVFGKFLIRFFNR